VWHEVGVRGEVGTNEHGTGQVGRWEKERAETYKFRKFRIRIAQEGSQPLVSFTKLRWKNGNYGVCCSITDGLLRAATRASGRRGIPQCRIRIGLTARRVEDSRPGSNSGTDIASCPAGG
jgi:hypothetical protein